MGRAEGGGTGLGFLGNNSAEGKQGAMTFWVEGMGGFGEVDGDSNAGGTSYDIWGTATGVEKELSDRLTGGVFYSYAQVDADVESLLDDADTDVHQLGCYAGYSAGPVNYEASVSGALMDANSRRVTSSGTAAGEYEGWGVYAAGQVSYDIALKEGVVLFPLAGI